MSSPDLSPDELNDLTRRAKKQLRSRMRATRRALPSAAVAARSARVIEMLTVRGVSPRCGSG